MLESEDRNPTFPHQNDWKQLTTEEKVDEMVIRNQTKISTVDDFNSHYFKEISSLSKHVKDTLNKDSRLNRNNPAEKRPPLKTVQKEIKKTRSRNNQHQNDKVNAFRAKTPEDFSLLELITKRSDGLMSVKGKTISLKQDQKEPLMSQSGTLKNFQIKAVEILERYHRIVGEFKEQSKTISGNQ